LIAAPPFEKIWLQDCNGDNPLGIELVPSPRAEAEIRREGREPIAAARLERQWRRVPFGDNSAELRADASVVDTERAVGCYSGVHAKG
jgi:hypothetical protein